jgi:hypothetical protein
MSFRTGKLGVLGAVAAMSTMLATPVMAQDYYAYRGGSPSGQHASDFGGQQDSRLHSDRNYAALAYDATGPGYGYSGYYAGRSGFWPGDVAATAVGGAIGLAGAAVDTAGAIATAPFRASNAYASMDEPGAGSASWCAQRYRSYDPSSGTYLGYDGRRHPCG